MEKQILKIEKTNQVVSQNFSSINGIIEKNRSNKFNTLVELKNLIGEHNGIDLGSGGSHIWAANKESKERLFIITGY